jgi:hypothetical protein
MIDHLIIFRCIAYTNISNQKRKSLIIKEKNGFLLVLVIIQKLKNHIILVPRKLLLVEMLFLMKLNFGHEAMMILNKILQLIQMAIMTKEGKIYGGSATINK